MMAKQSLRTALAVIVGAGEAIGRAIANGTGDLDVAREWHERLVGAAGTMKWAALGEDLASRLDFMRRKFNAQPYAPIYLGAHTLPQYRLDDVGLWAIAPNPQTGVYEPEPNSWGGRVVPLGASRVLSVGIDSLKVIDMVRLVAATKEAHTARTKAEANKARTEARKAEKARIAARDLIEAKRRIKAEREAARIAKAEAVSIVIE
jgi:hypothetical protein